MEDFANFLSRKNFRSSALKDKKLLELKEAMHKYHKAKDEELVLRHNKRREFLDEGNSLSKSEQMLRADDELFHKKREVSQLGDMKNQLKLTVEIINGYYWKARL